MGERAPSVALADLATDYGFGSTEFHVVRGHSDKVDQRYLLHFMRQDWIRAEGERRMTGSGGQRRVPATFLRDLSIPLLPLRDQKRITAILDEADQLRCKRKVAVRRVEEIKQAIFHNLLGNPFANTRCWDRVALSECVVQKDDIRCGPFDTQLLKQEFTNAGIPLWGIKQVNRRFLIPTHEFISELKARELSNYDIIPGDIVMTRKGTIGNCAVYPPTYISGIMHSDLLRVRLDLSICNPTFLSDQLRWSPDVARQIDLISGGAIMQGINVGKLKQIRVLRPPIDVQREYAERIDALEGIRISMTLQNKEADALFTSLQHRAFRGEL